jgi:hypothetical protein
VNPVEWLVYAAALQLQRQEDAVWLAYPLRVRQAVGSVVHIGVRLTNPLDLKPLIDALRN